MPGTGLSRTGPVTLAAGREQSRRGLAARHDNLGGPGCCAHENVQLAGREGAALVFIERLTGRGAVPVLTRLGGRFALHATGGWGDAAESWTMAAAFRAAARHTSRSLGSQDTRASGSTARSA